ncbi:MAG: hypothetical protein OET44_11485 [Gammaproteobacteria bacterium]|nr:hypothetical protein [Gammaproteobacteria bacterium]
MRGLAVFVMRGPMQAGLVAAASLALSLIVPPALWIGGASVALYALRKGLTGGLAAGGVAALGSLALLWASLGQPDVGVLLALTVWVPVLSVAAVLRATVRLQLSVWVAAGFGLIVIGLLFMLVDDPAEMWYEGLSQALPAARVQAELGMQPADFDAQAWQELLARIAALMSGFTGAALTVNTLVSLLLARWWQAILFNPGGFGEEFRELRLGRVAGSVALVVMVAAWLLQTGFLVNVAVLLVAVYLFQGLAVAHGVVKQRDLGRGWLVGLYVLLFFAFVHMALLIALLGMLDGWTDIRRRWAAAPPS